MALRQKSTLPTVSRTWQSGKVLLMRGVRNDPESAPIVRWGGGDLINEQPSNFLQILMRQGIIAAAEPLPAVDSRRIAGAGRRTVRNLQKTECLASGIRGDPMGLAAGIDLFDVSQHRHLFLGVIISPHVSDPAHRKLQAHKDDEEQCQSDNLAASQPAAGI